MTQNTTFAIALVASLVAGPVCAEEARLAWQAPGYVMEEVVVTARADLFNPEKELEQLLRAQREALREEFGRSATTQDSG